MLNDREIDDSIALFENISLKKDDFFLVERNICNKVGFILKGSARRFSTLENGDENIICFKFENQFITSYESFMFRQPSSTGIQVLENCDLLVITYKNFQYLLEKIPSWKHIINLLTEQEYMEKENYLLNFNNKSAKEKYLQILAQSPQIVQRIKVGHLASYLGITQRTLTRVRREILHADF
jgi:CRP-like cAMP-binding protein